MAEKIKQRLLTRIKNKYIVVVYNQDNLQERVSLSLTPLNVLLLLVSLISFTFVLTAILILTTPLKETFSPSNSAESGLIKANILQTRVDSLERALKQEKTIETSLKNFLKGDTTKLE